MSDRTSLLKLLEAVERAAQDHKRAFVGNPAPFLLDSRNRLWRTAHSIRAKLDAQEQAEADQAQIDAIERYGGSD